MDDSSENEILQIISRVVIELPKDFDEYMCKWIEVQGLAVTFNNIKEPEDDYFQIIYN